MPGRSAALPAAEPPVLPAPRAESEKPIAMLPPAVKPAKDRFPIDLSTVWRLAGANNLQIALASERIREATAQLEGARALWLPSLQFGVGYNRHDGQIQDTRGDILEVSRSSVYTGGGANLGAAPLNGGTNGPARLFVGLPLADALFAPLAQRQVANAASAHQAATFNDTLLQVSIGYLELVRSYGECAIALEAVKNAEELVRLISARVKAGTAPPADEYRARAELADRQRQSFAAEETLHVASAELVRLLRLDPATVLFPLDLPVPIELIGATSSLPELIAQGWTSRPELARHQALVAASLTRLRQEHWRPFVPAVQIGVSGGGFGGGRNSFIGNYDGRSDFDALLVWDVRGLGFGNRALRRERQSQNMQANLAAEQIRDLIAAEISSSYYQVRFRGRQLDSTRDQVHAAAEAVPLNFKGILGGQLRAIEAQQAIQALVQARQQYLGTLTDYNGAQFQLLRALGQPPSASTTP
ncbi:MAG: TolC family protein [Gemmataceae bacterium]